ncbi:MAG TPA: hypothetical protein VGQ26_00205 [Streptosporangiaceae bacterium]|nr:hypothetical protein [Streptosporangiaceae bacterium]
MTQQPGRSGQDPIGDFQRWLVRSGARSVSREVGGQLRSMIGYRGRSADVWETATMPTDEAPECAWCPVCRAARVLRESGPGVTSQMAAVGDVVTALAQDTMSVFEAALAATGRAARSAATEPGQGPSGTVWADAADGTAQDPEAEPESAGPPEGPPHEPDDRG